MTWLRSSDEEADDPRYVRVRELAHLLDYRARLYCARNETDGLVPKAMLGRLADWSGVSFEGSPVEPAALAARLVAVGLWEDRDSDYFVVTFLASNWTHAKLQDHRKAEAEKKAKGRSKQGRSASGHVTSDVPEGVPEGQTKGLPKGITKAVPPVYTSPSSYTSPSLSAEGSNCKNDEAPAGRRAREVGQA